MDIEFDKLDSYLAAKNFFEHIGVEPCKSIWLNVLFSGNLSELNGLYEVEWCKKKNYGGYIDVDINGLEGKFHPNYNSNLQQMIFKNERLFIEGIDNEMIEYRLEISKP